MARAPSGFVYVATDLGLWRYDGRNGVPLPTRDRLPGIRTADRGHEQVIDGPVSAIAVGAAGDDDVIWAALRGGDVVAFRDGRVTTVLAATAIEGQLVTRLLADPAGSLWIGTTRGLWVLRAAGLEKTAVQERITALRWQQPGTVWIGTTQGLHRAGSGDRTAVAIKGMEAVEDLQPGHEAGLVWVAGADRALHIVRAGPGPVRIDEVMQASPPRDPPLSLSRASAGGIWVSYRYHCGRITEDAKAIVESAPCEDARAMAGDLEMGLWVARFSGEVLWLDRPRARVIPVDDPEHPPLAFSVLGDGNVVWAAVVGGVVRADGAGQTFLRNGLAYRAHCPRSLTRAAKGGVWLATCDDGLWRINDHAGVAPTAVPVNGSPKALIGTFQTRDGSLWSSEINGGLWKFNGESFHEVSFGSPRCDFSTGLDPLECASAVVAMAETANRTLWLGTRGAGLYRLDRTNNGTPAGQAEAIGSALGLQGHRPIALHVDRHDHLWVADAQMGLQVLSDGRFRRVAGRELPDSVFAIIDDAAGWLWITHENGVSRTLVKDLVAYVEGGRDEPSWFSHSLAEGSVSFRPNQEWMPPLAGLDDGGVAVPTSGGAVLVTAPDQASRERPGRPRLDRILVDGVTVAAIDSVDLGFTSLRAAAISIGIAVMFAGSPENLRVHYRLEGVDADWRRDDGRLTATYHDVPAGKRTFSVKSFVAGYERDAVVLTVPVGIRGFFQHPLAWALMLLPLVPIGTLAMWLRERALKARFRAILDERSRIARDVHDTIAQYFATFSHEIEALRDVLVRGETRAALAISEQVAELVARCRMEVRHIIRGLRRPQLPSATDLVSDLEDLMAQLRVLDTVEISLHVQGTPPARDALGIECKRHLGRLAQEAISNAIAHGKADTINVTLRHDDQALVLSIADDGVGFEPAAVEGDESLLHFGLLGMRERASLIGAAIKIESQPGRGSTVTVHLPWVAAKGAEGVA